MSRRRSVDQPFRGKVGPNGERLCCWCGKAVPPRAIRWCGRECVLRYQIATGDQNAARSWLVWGPVDPTAFATNSEALAARRPLGCELCGLDMSDEAIEERLRQRLERIQQVNPNVHERSWKYHARASAERWEADHRIPIVEGGELTPENLRVLCRPCHLNQTRLLAARRAAARRQAKERT